MLRSPISEKQKPGKKIKISNYDAKMKQREGAEIVMAGTMNRKSDQTLEDLSIRKNKWNIVYNNYTMDLLPQAGVSVYQSGHKKQCDPGFVCGPDSYDHYIVHLILSGCGTYSCNDVNYKVSTNDMFLIEPYVPVVYVADEKTPWTYYWVGFNGYEIQRLLQLSGYSSGKLVQNFGNSKTLVKLMGEIASIKSSNSAKQCLLTGYLYQVFSELIDNSKSIKASSVNEYFYQSLYFIRQKYSDSTLTVDMISKEIGIERSYLYRIFMSETNLSVQEFICLFRLSKAAELLRGTRMTIAQIAYACGFSNQSYFSTLFKKTLNETPQQYRKRLT